MSVISIRPGRTAPAGTWTKDSKSQVKWEEAA
jgi:hypothetical protein